jgi:hypothetical protein
MQPSRHVLCASVLLLALFASAALAQNVGDIGIDLTELEGEPVGGAATPALAPPAPPAPPPAPAPASALVKPLAAPPGPNPMPLQWVPLGAPRNSELLDSMPSGASFSVAGIAQQGDAYVAIIEYKGQSFIVQPGTMVPDQDDPAFQVRAITSSRVEAFDPVMRRLVRRSLPPLGR